MWHLGALSRYRPATHDWPRPPRACLGEAPQPTLDPIPQPTDRPPGHTQTKRRAFTLAPPRHPDYEAPHGEVPEWSIGAVSKTVEPLRAPWVRIPPSPPLAPFLRCRMRTVSPPRPHSEPILPPCGAGIFQVIRAVYAHHLRRLCGQIRLAEPVQASVDPRNCTCAVAFNQCDQGEQASGRWTVRGARVILPRT